MAGITRVTDCPQIAAQHLPSLHPQAATSNSASLSTLPARCEGVATNAGLIWRCPLWPPLYKSGEEHRSSNICTLKHRDGLHYRVATRRQSTQCRFRIGHSQHIVRTRTIRCLTCKYTHEHQPRDTKPQRRKDHNHATPVEGDAESEQVDCVAASTPDQSRKEPTRTLPFVIIDDSPLDQAHHGWTEVRVATTTDKVIHDNTRRATTCV